MQSPILSHAPVAVASERTIARVFLRLIPFMIGMYIVNYLDRVNLSFAADRMKHDLSLSATAYGFGAGIFFLGYALFEVPSNLMMERIGARRWMARIMFSWGIVSSCMMFIRGPWSLYFLRFLLGAAEAGLFPGMVLYLTYWIPSRQRARAVAMFLTATALAGVIGGPLTGLILKMNGFHGLKGWQWVFLLESLPSIFGGFVVLAYLTDKPAHAHWLEPEERDLLEATLQRERDAQAQSADTSHHSMFTALQDQRLWLLSLLYACLMVGLYVFAYWMPLMLKTLVVGITDTKVALYAAIPYSCASISMVLWGRHSDTTGERRWHVAIPALVAACGLFTLPFCHSLPTALASFSVAAIGIWSSLGPFWSLPTVFLRGTAAAGGIAAINSLGCLAGWGGPYLVGYLKDRTHTFTAPVFFWAFALIGGAILVLSIPLTRRETRGFPVA